MTPEPEANLDQCLDCGRRLCPENRLYAVGCQNVICMACALGRGGQYDQTLDRWVVPPTIGDLLTRAQATADQKGFPARSARPGRPRAGDNGAT